MTSSSDNPMIASGDVQAGERSAGEWSYDAFISYSRRDKTFAAMLHKALEAYVPPRGLGLPLRHLKVFRDESDLTGVEYHAAIRTHLENSSKLIVICSPQARASSYVGEEIRDFGEARGTVNIVPVLVSGIPNNEARPGHEADLAFPQALVDAMAMPLAVSYSDFDAGRNHDVTKGAFYGAWCTLIANLLNLRRGDVEQRETRRRARRRRAVAGISAAVGTALCVALVLTLISRNEAATQRDRAIAAIGRIFSERAWQNLDRRAGFLAAKYALAGRQIAPSTERDQQLVLASILQGTTELMAVLQHPALPRSASFGGPGGDLVVTTSEDGEARIWDWRSGKQVRTFTGHELATTWASFEPRGKTVVSTSADATARVWDASSGEDVVAPLSHPRPVVWASFSPDASQIVTVSRMEGFSNAGQGLHLWNATDGRLLWTASPKDDILTVDFTPDGKDLVYVIAGGTAEYRDRRSGMLRRSRNVGQGTPSAAAVDAAHDLLVLVQENVATLFRLGTGEQVLQFPNGAAITAVAIAPSGSAVATGGADGTVNIWEATTGYRIAAQAGHKGSIVNVAFNSDGNLIVTASTDATVRVWKASRTVAAVSAPESPAVAFSGDGSRLALASANKLAVLEAPSFQVIAQRTLPGTEQPQNEDYVFAASFSPDANQVVTTTSAGEISSHAVAGIADKVLYRAGSLFAAALSPGARLAAVVRFDSPTKVSLINVSSGEDFVLPGEPGGVVTQLQFSGDGSRLAAGAQDGWVSVWDTVARKTIMSTEAHPSPSGTVSFRLDGGTLRGVALSNDGKLVAYALGNGTSHVRDVMNREVAVLEGTDGTKSIAFAADSRLIATGGGRGVTLYDVRTSRWLAGFGKPSLSVAFARDGRFLVASGGSFSFRRNGNVRSLGFATEVWDITRVVQGMQELVAATCATFLASEMHRFSDFELAADPILREVWGTRTYGEQRVCPGKD